LFVTTMDFAALIVFTVCDPKLSEPGAYLIWACAGIGDNTKPARTTPTDRHTSSVFFMDRIAFVFFSGARLERGGRGEGPGDLRSRFFNPE
jgi:hypothetical protein